MNKKSTPIIIGLVCIAIVVVIVLVGQGKKNGNYPPSQNNDISSQTQGTQSDSTLVSKETTNGTGATKTPVTKKPGEYTMADVAKHNNASDCWTTINGGVYNVTSWIYQHPGGSEAIISLCGIDGSDAFNQQHGGQRRPANELASFKIGTLVQ